MLAFGRTLIYVVEIEIEIGRTNSDVQKRDEQTDKQTKKLNVFGNPGGG